MNIEKVFFEEYKQKNINENNIIKDIKKKIKKAKYVYIFGELCNIPNKEWIEEYKIDVFLEKQYLNSKVVHVHNIQNIIYKIKIDHNNVERILNILIDIVCKLQKNEKADIHFIFGNNKNGILEINFDKDEYIIEDKEKSNIIMGLGIIFLIIFIIAYVLIFQYKLVFKVTNNKEIGIIEGEYSYIYDNVEYNTEPNYKVKELTHGDKMLQFLNNISNNLKIYYYDASSSDGKINTDNILAGLEYLKEKNIKIINISLSSKVYSVDLEKWIKENPDIKVFASYNNLINSVDYPAMYENVYGSGKKEEIKYKDIDYTYYTNKVIIFPEIFKVYEGNSYLSLYNAIIEE